MQFTNKKVIVTGGAKGIGEAVVNKFLDEGATVIILDRHKPLTYSKEKTPALHYYKCDVSKYEELEKVFSNIKDTFKTIDALVNNAGIQTYGTVTDTSEELWDRTMNVNVKSMFLCSKMCIPLMVKSKGAAIINVSSVQAMVTQREVAAYATSKAAILGLTNSIAVDYAPSIRCVAICPGAVMTPMLKNTIEGLADFDEAIKDTENIHLLKRIAKPEEIADFIVFAASSKGSFMTGQHYRIDGGIGVELGGR
ncbi:SDR family oxidoreductase [Arenibacter sp. ARW7G5Y1]|uniref:SDR family oxidoreductase n=1 Tax=Arenibacter sp. ARW7G5Y1 TaxID=2135619 RepID=UPI000D765448|nr:SDR family oxidoreductase [Arenibacter sp. ARW7G5Y1]PXX30582.1 NAD(P)-dependent dehydrogenase (short-subunit alcohol dehydrogenase family) [Arenibacter sp. ARW7G5Y1]